MLIPINGVPTRCRRLRVGTFIRPEIDRWADGTLTNKTASRVKYVGWEPLYRPIVPIAAAPKKPRPLAPAEFTPEASLGSVNEWAFGLAWSKGLKNRSACFADAARAVVRQWRANQKAMGL